MTFYEWIKQCLQHAAEEGKTDSAPIIEKVLKEIEKWNKKK